MRVLCDVIEPNRNPKHTIERGLNGDGMMRDIRTGIDSR